MVSSQKRHGLQLPAALVQELGLPPREDEGTPRGGPAGRGHGVGAGRGRGGGRGGRGGLLGRKEARKAARNAKKQQRHEYTRNRAQAHQTTPAHRPKSAPSRSADTEAEPHMPKRLQGLKVIGKVKAPAPKPPQPPHPTPPAATDTKEKKGKRKHRSVSPGESEGEQEVRAKKKKTSNTKTPLQRLLEKAGGRLSPRPGEGDEDEKRTERASRRERPLSKAERDEEDEIAWLEYKLGKNRGKGEEDDGLDDLLDDLDRFYPGMYDAKPDVPDESEQGASDADSFYGFDSQDEAMSGSEEYDSPSDEDENAEEDPSGSEAETHGSSDNDAGMDEDKTAPAPARHPPAAPTPAATEGKYVPPALRRLQAAKEAKTAEATEPVSAYDDPANTHLKRQLKGQLNRLGEGNLDGILTTLEGIFSGNSRAVVTQILTRLLIDAVVYAARATDQFIVLNAALISALHRTIGIEFGASFIADLTAELVGAYDTAQTAQADAVQKIKQEGGAAFSEKGGPEEGEPLDVDKDSMQVVDPMQEENGKKSLNLVSLLCELYNLQTVSCLLVYDLIRHFAQPAPSSAGLSELSVELLLRIVRLCGAQLRSDDPSSLRDIVDFIQENAVPVPESKTTLSGLPIPQKTAAASVLSSRSKFMLERLADLRSGRAQRQGGAGTSDTLTRMKKFVSGLGKKRALRTYDAVRVTLKDLQDADRKGRWWLVGAAWTGHDGDGGEGVTAKRPLTSRKADEVEDADDEESKKHKALVAYARSHGLGTAVRQGIFVTIMTSVDFADAAARLQALRLNEVQRREIVRVLVRCMQIDTTYNPYFALIGFQLAGPHVGDSARAVRFTMQYALWDFMRATLGQTGVAGKSRAEADGEGDEMEVDEDVDEKRIANVARSYAWWIAKGALTLNVLKTVDFVALRPKARFFLQHLLVNTLLSTQTRSPSLSEATMGDRDRDALERVVVQGTVGNVELTRGLLVFTKTHLGPRDQKKIAGNVAIGDRLHWALGVVRETLQVGASLGGGQ